MLAAEVVTGAAGPGGEGVGMLEAVPACWWWCCGATTIKVCFCTAFEAGMGGGDDYFCTVPTLHRRRRWIVAGGGEAGGGGMVPGGGHGGGCWQAIPPSLRYGWDDMSVWLAEIFF